MLSDIERKVLTIVRNYVISRGSPPSITQLCRKTGRSEKGTMQVLWRLEEEWYIRLEGDQIVPVQLWEYHLRL